MKRQSLNQEFPNAVAVLDDHREQTTPWQTLHQGEQPPMMFEARLMDGRRMGFAYSDLRDCTLFNPGKLVLGIWGRAELTITIEGKNLDELYTNLLVCKVRWIAECDQRVPEQPDAKGKIDSIKIEPVTDEKS